MPYCSTATPNQYAMIEELLILPEKVDENKDEDSDKKEE